MNRYICNMSNVLVPVHAVINTYCRRMTIFPEHEELLYRNLGEVALQSLGNFNSCVVQPRRGCYAIYVFTPGTYANAPVPGVKIAWTSPRSAHTPFTY